MHSATRRARPRSGGLTVSSISDVSDAWAEYEYLGNSIHVCVPALVTPANHEPQLPAAVSVEDFYAYMPMHQYLFVPTRDLWPGASVNARCAPPRNADG